MDTVKCAARLLLLVCALLLLAVPGWTQVTYGEITGTITDESKAVIPAVEVIATNVATGVARNGVSEANGIYRIPLLQPGTYTVKAALSGFKTSVLEGVTVTVGQTVRLDITMGVGNIAETVTVSVSDPSGIEDTGAAKSP